MPVGFEGSYLGAEAKISPRATMECKICWTPYDPAEGDETRQIPPGTPFVALPEDWKCPTCDGPKEQFMVLDDPDAVAEAALEQAVARLVAEFKEIHASKMRDTPLSNKSLHVEAVGFRLWNGRYLGVLVTPWFMNLTLLPGPDDDWSGLTTGEKELIEFPSGVYEFIHTVRDEMGGYKGCSLFSPMNDFTSQLQATDVAREVMQALFSEEHREETDNAATIRRMREEELAAAAETAPKPLDPAPSRRAVLTAGLSDATEASPA